MNIQLGVMGGKFTHPCLMRRILKLAGNTYIPRVEEQLRGRPRYGLAGGFCKLISGFISFNTLMATDVAQCEGLLGHGTSDVSNWGGQGNSGRTTPYCMNCSRTVRKNGGALIKNGGSQGYGKYLGPVT